VGNYDFCRQFDAGVIVGIKREECVMVCLWCSVVQIAMHLLEFNFQKKNATLKS
jgi:hypothetical protein